MFCYMKENILWQEQNCFVPATKCFVLLTVFSLEQEQNFFVTVENMCVAKHERSCAREN